MKSICKTLAILATLFSINHLALAESNAYKISSNLAVISMDKEELETRKLVREKLGALHVPTGELVTADMLVNPDRPAYSKKVKSGDYDVYLYRLTGGDPRVALAELKLSDAEPVKWQLALIEGQDASKLENDQFFGFPVDAGIGSFFDKAAYTQMKKRETLERENLGRDEINYFDDVLYDEMYSNGDYDIPVIHQPMKNSPLNFAVFGSGWGDGYYPTFWGLDKNGTPSRLVIDFFIATNGDARSPREQQTAKVEETITDAQRQAALKAYFAVKQDDFKTLESLLQTGLIKPDSWLLDGQAELQEYAISLDKPEAIKLLVEFGTDGRLSDFMKSQYGLNSLYEVAQRLNSYTGVRKPLSSEMMQLLETLPVK